MAGTKKKTTMAKIIRERKVRERRLDKEARKQARKLAAAEPHAAADPDYGTVSESDPAAADPDYGTVSESDPAAAGEHDPAAVSEPDPAAVGGQ